MKDFLFFDTETTGNKETDFLCQLAYKHGDEEFSELYKTSIPIPPEASAVHHITNKMIADKPLFKDSKDYKTIKSLFEDTSLIPVAHNAKFDINMLKKEGIEFPKFICTLRLARYLDKENKIPRYNLQFLRYYLNMEIEATAHDAMGDVKVLEALFERLKIKMVEEFGDDDKALEQMIAISARPSLLNMFAFGKYNGKTIAEVAKTDRGYLKWLLEQKMQNEADEEDWIYTLKYYLENKKSLF
ncbi:MAG: exonuclease domain-containing protein [Candidatus Pacebacteria bacterium]|nr:exonuclease domain-containing protein [Candidatus Paceibacterota bacterium]